MLMYIDFLMIRISSALKWPEDFSDVNINENRLKYIVLQIESNSHVEDVKAVNPKLLNCI